MGQFIGTITHVSTRELLVALTFDDGPHPDYALRLLDILERHQAHATFFMLGEAAKRHPEIVTMVARQGHAIGNHSWDHPSFPLVNGRERRAQIRACGKAIEPWFMRYRDVTRQFYQRLRDKAERIYLGDLFEIWGYHRKAIVDNVYYDPNFNQFLAKNVADYISLKALKPPLTLVDESAATGGPRQVSVEPH